MTLVGSLSGFPISKLVAGPVAQLIEDQLTAAGRQARSQSAAASMDGQAQAVVYPASTTFVSGAAEGSASYRSVVEAYGEWGEAKPQTDNTQGDDR